MGRDESVERVENRDSRTALIWQVRDKRGDRLMTDAIACSTSLISRCCSRFESDSCHSAQR
jgi:hypothetical protein